MRISDWSSDVCSSDLPATYSYVYLSSNPLKIGFQPYDPDAPPNDVANTTTDQGVTVPFIVRVETGYQDRDKYQIAVLWQPGTDWSAVQPQAECNHQLLLTHGLERKSASEGKEVTEPEERGVV